MKCIKTIKATKNNEVGVVKRMSEVESESRVKSGFWMYVSKSEFKQYNNIPYTEKLRRDYPVNVEGSEENNKRTKKK